MIHRLTLCVTTLCMAGLCMAGATSPALAASTSWTITMTGNAEIPGPGNKDGAGTAIVSVDDTSDTICYSMSVVRIGAATAAHVHSGPAGIAGPHVAILATPGADGISSGCVPVSHDLATAILSDPSAYYVNVHTADFPKGALRGQLPAG